MSRSLRFLMGIAIVSILVPAMAVVVPHEDNERASPATAQAMATIERDPTLSQPPPEDPRSSHPTASTAEGTSSSVETSSWEDDVPAIAVTDHSEHSDHLDRPDDEAKVGPEDSSTTAETSRPETTTTSASSETSGSILTGAACPCTIKGTAELKGEISLKGDLIVDGGTLVARPGVNLNGNGYQIMFMNGGIADFQGSKVFTWSDRGAKQNLQRDINFRDLRRIMWMANGGPSILKYFTVSDSGTSAVGDYPLHWHLNGNSTKGTIVEGVVVINGKHHAYVPHGSHGIHFRDVIAKNTRDDAFWWDPPGTNDCSGFKKFCTADNSNNITYDHVLVDGVALPHGHSGHHTVSGFQLGAGSGNVVRNSAAINISGGKNCSGFKWPSHANQNAGGNVWAFTDNFSKSAKCHGIYVWQNDSNNHVIQNFTGSGIHHGAYGNDYHYRSFDVPYLNIHASGWIASDGRIGTVVAHRHQQRTHPTVSFTNVVIDRFIVDNSGGEPGHYVLDHSGLICADIEYEDVESGTKVVVDGEECDRNQ